MLIRNITAKNNHVSSIPRTSRLRPLRAAMRPLLPFGACLTGLLLFQPPAQGGDPLWDCRMAADGRGW